MCALRGMCGDDENGFVLRRHEVSVSGAFFQRMWFDSPLFDKDDTAFLPDDYLVSMAGISEYEKVRMTGSWKISYTYNASRIFGVELGLRYEGYRDNYYDSATDTKTRRFCDDLVGLMAALRVNWLNRRILRVYSSAGGGVSFLTGRADYSKSGGPVEKYAGRVYGDWEVVPVGFTVGKSVFGIVELGIGTEFTGGRFGVGYRF